MHLKYKILYLLYLPWEITIDYIFQITNLIILAINEIMMTLKNNIKMIN